MSGSAPDITHMRTLSSVHGSTSKTPSFNVTSRVDSSITSRFFSRKPSWRNAVDYRAFVKVGNTWVNWIASLLLLVPVLFSTTANLYYQLKYHNVVEVMYPDKYAADSEWLFGPLNSGVLNISLVYTFIESDSLIDITRLKQAFFNTPPGPFNNTTPCVILVGQDAGSFYAFCDQFDPVQVPEWARSFDALIIQTIYLTTVEQYKEKQSFTPYLGIAQGFRNNRTGWYQQDTLERLYCTTKQLSSASNDYAERVLFTKAHGLLRSVDCSSPAEANTEACIFIRDDVPFVLFGDHTGILRTYEVVRQADGKDFILGPFSSKEKIGQRTESKSVWPIDDCLYVRGDSIGWFGAGYLWYYPQIPTMALVAKLELIGMLFVVWLVKFRCALYRAHHALFQMSRLGFFQLLVAQVLFSAYQEQDIMRTIYSWHRRYVADWLLFWYILSTVALAGGLCALAVLRLSFESSVCKLGASIAMILPIPIALVELWIAEINYSAHSPENGLQNAPSLECPPGYVGCAFGKFNYLYLVIFMVFVPSLVEMLRLTLRSRPVLTLSLQATRVQPTTLGPEPPQRLTTFEQICLDGLLVTRIVKDYDDPYVDVKGVHHVNADMIGACGFTVIQNRFVVRTKDLTLLLLATVASMIPWGMSRDASMVVWPLKLQSNGTMCVTTARRVFLRYIDRVCVHEKHRSASLICSDEYPLA